MSTYSTPIPGAPGYEQSALLSRRAYDNAMARFQQQRSSTLLKYGYNQDASGNLSVDPNNEYGQYQQMLRGEAGQTEGLQRHQAASGWDTSSGYLGAQQDELQHAQGAEQANLGTSLIDTLANIKLGEQSAALDQDTANYQTQLDAARNAVNQGNFNPADYSNLDTPDYGAGPAAPAAPKTKPKNVQLMHQAAKRQLIAKVTKRRQK